MILIAGGTGTLGRELVRQLTGRGVDMRILTRDPARALHLGGERVELVPGDVRQPAPVQRAMVGIDTVISAIHGFVGDGTPETIDREGNRTLIQAAKAAGVGRFVLMSIHGAAPEHPLDLFRMKAAAEQELRGSGLSWTIVRPTAYMETWLRLIAEPLLTSGTTRLFGRGQNPINLVSVRDVAWVVAQAATDPALANTVIEVGGPENLTMRQVAETVERVTGRTGKVQTTPRAMMRVMALLARPVKPAMARQVRAGLLMDTTDMTFDDAALRARFPALPRTTLADVVHMDYVDRVANGKGAAS